MEIKIPENRKINEIIIHCSATSANWMQKASVEKKVAAIDRMHKRRGWKGIGYHYVIDRDGSIGIGRDVNKQGAHSYGRNRDTIGVCLIGGHGGNADDSFKDHFTECQEDALLHLLEEYKKGIPKIIISGHNQYRPKACPCFIVPNWYENKDMMTSIPVKTESRKSITQSNTMRASTGGMLSFLGGSGAGGVALFKIFSTLDIVLQIILLSSFAFVLLSFAIIMRERILKWINGDR